MRLLRYFFLTFFSLLILSSFAEAQEKKKVLVVLSYDESLPWSKEFLQGLQDYYDAHNGKFDYFIERVDSSRLIDTEKTRNSWMEYLKNKYGDVQLDGILLESDLSVKLFHSFKENIFPDVPVVEFGSLTAPLKGNVAIRINSMQMINRSIDLAKKQNPNLQQAFLVNSEHQMAKAALNLLQQRLELNGIKVTLIKDFSMQELIQKVSKLPKNSALFYILLVRDKTGAYFIPRDVSVYISKAAPVPTYSFVSAQIGSGTIGGDMIEASKVAGAMMDALTRLWKHQVPKEYYNLSRIFLDWEVMQRFGIGADTIPEGAIVINRPDPIWVTHPLTVFMAITLIILLSLLSLTLFVINIRNKRIARMEEQMILQSRQAAMGEMLNIIAHQWRQPLNALSLVMQNMGNLMKNNTVDSAQTDNLSKKGRALTLQMSNTIDDFRNFFKPKKEGQKFSIAKELHNIVRLVEEAYKQDDIKIEMETEDVILFGHPNELGQCILNILQNARDALVEKNNGREKAIYLKTSIQDNTVLHISIEDNGGGIPQKVLPKVFEPYFSTKDEHNGTGIGLYMSKMIIEEHMGGKIKASNTEQGALFEIVLSKTQFERTSDRGKT